MFLQIEHTTEYSYGEPVGLTPHVLRIIPRSSPGLHLIRSELTISPEHSVKWNLDLEGNIVGLATFPGLADKLLIKSSLLIEQHLNNPFDFLLDSHSLHLPFVYDDREQPLLAPFLKRRDGESAAHLDEFVRPFLNGSATKPITLNVLTAINRAIPAIFRYTHRHEAGVRLAWETSTYREGTCRDFAHLFIEAARSLGIAARYVSGYLCSSPSDPGENHTHGWCELYLPGAGWRGLDPTNGILAGPHHVAVATSLVAGEIPPVEGTYCGKSGLCTSHEVSITARELLPGEEK
jgi:transglutaminase-like putative cysteine protease